MNKDELDIILISDCIYEGLYGDSWKLLFKVINDLVNNSKNKNNIVIFNSVERRKEDGIDDFNNLMIKNNFKLTKIYDYTNDDDEHLQLYKYNL